MEPVVLPVQHIQQRQDGECLAACAAMLLTFIGQPIEYERLVKLLAIEPGLGTPSSRIRNLTRWGVTVEYRQGNIRALQQHLARGQPCIAFVRTSELPYWPRTTEHAVVIIGLDDSTIYLNDPAFVLAPIQVSHGDFDLAWLEHDEKYAVITR
jgi:ABC-type bacteriocin/lantibiotic exporter with double-glycine peptidase domain